MAARKFKNIADGKFKNIADGKFKNIAVLGCSSSGKSTIVAKLAEMFDGVVVSLDSHNADGRSLAAVGAKPKEFMEGDLIRQKMMEEAKEASKHKKPFFIDDAFTDIIPYLNKKTTKIVLIIPTITRIMKNVKSRNMNAVTSAQERLVSSVLLQLVDFIRIASEQEQKQEKQEKNNGIWVSPKDIYTATELDKMFYDRQDWDKWEAILLRNLHLFGFGVDDLKTKTRFNKSYLFIPKNIGQHTTIISDDQTPSDLIDLLLK